MLLSHMRCAAKYLCAAAATGVFVLATPNANAALILNINSGAVIIADNGGGDTDPASGRIINTSTVAGFNIVITVATSNSPGTSSAGILQIQSLDVRNFNAGQATLTLDLSDTNFTAPGSAGTAMRLDSAVGGTFTQGQIGDNVTFQSFADPNNGQPAGPVSTAVLSAVRATGNTTENFNTANSVSWVRGGGPYSLANYTTVTLSPGGQMNISGTTTAVPEPVSFAAIGLAGFAMVRRSRR